MAGRLDEATSRKVSAGTAAIAVPSAAKSAIATPAMAMKTGAPSTRPTSSITAARTSSAAGSAPAPRPARRTAASTKATRLEAQRSEARQAKRSAMSPQRQRHHHLAPPLGHAAGQHALERGVGLHQHDRGPGEQRADRGGERVDVDTRGVAEAAFGDELAGGEREVLAGGGGEQRRQEADPQGQVLHVEDGARDAAVQEPAREALERRQQGHQRAGSPPPTTSRSRAAPRAAPRARCCDRRGRLLLG